MTNETARERVEAALGAWEAFVAAREAMNAAIPDPTKATPAERALYDERYKADHEAEREHWRTAIALFPSGDLRELLRSNGEGIPAISAEAWRTVERRAIRKSDGAWGHMDDNGEFQPLAGFAASPSEPGEDALRELAEKAAPLLKCEHTANRPNPRGDGGRIISSWIGTI